jgi:hypothetical protein
LTRVGAFGPRDVGEQGELHGDSSDLDMGHCRVVRTYWCYTF